MTDNNKKTKQITFYMMPSETMRVVEYVGALNCSVYSPRSNSEIPAKYADCAYSGQIYVCPSDLENQIVMNRAETVYFLASDVSPVIEFSCCILHKNTLSLGRLYCRSGYEGRDGWVAFPDSLWDLFTKMQKYMKENVFERKRDGQVYIGNEIKEFLAHNGELRNF